MALGDGSRKSAPPRSYTSLSYDPANLRRGIHTKHRLPLIDEADSRHRLRLTLSYWLIGEEATDSVKKLKRFCDRELYPKHDSKLYLRIR